jgi:hypothetical protein
MTNKRIYNTNAWKTLRRQVLEEENHICHWCGKKATQVDHLIELDRDPSLALERSNLVASCQPCNSRRGNAYRAKKQAQKRIQRDTPNAGFFGSDKTPTPPPLFSVSQTNETDLSESEQIETDGNIFGRIEPRLVTPALGHETLGGFVTDWVAKHLDYELMDWQRTVLDGQLSHDGTGQLEFSESLVSVGRQNGKSWCMGGLICAWLTDLTEYFGRPQVVISAAHKLDRAFALFKEFAPVLEAKYGAKINWSYGRNFVEMPNGSRWHVTAATPQNAHGASADLVCLDEIWSIGTEVIFDAYRPTMTARPNPLMSMWSTAGDESSRVMLQLREQAIHAIDNGKQSGLYFAEWSPPPGAPLDNPDTWRWSNPAMGTTITAERLRRMSETPNKQAFYRAHCNVWISAAASWLPAGLWPQLEVDDDMPAGGVLAVDADVTDLRYCGVRVAPKPDGTLQVKTEFVVESAEAMWEATRVVMEDANVQLALTPGLFALVPLDLSRRTKDFGQREITTYTAIVRNMILEKKIVHTGQMALSEQVQRAVSGRVGGTITLSSQKSPGPIEQCRCMVVAAGMAAKPVGNVRKPMIGTAR